MKVIWQFNIILLLNVIFIDLSAQVDSVWNQKPTLRLSGFADVFYVYDFNQPQRQLRQSFLFNHNRHNEFNLNLGLLKIEVEHKKYRANLAMQTGTYVNDNYASEPGVLKNIYEANIGIALNKKNKLWLDAGVLPSHIGFESAISMDNLTLTRSLLAENSPYFLTGINLSFKPNSKWEVAGLIVNGWQRIQRLQGNSTVSFGTKFSFNPSDKINFNWSTFIGTDDPDSTRRMRYFNNLHSQIQVSKKFALIAGFDIGTQQNQKNSAIYKLWFSPVLIGQLSFNTCWKVGMRVEYYQDKTGIMIPTAFGFQTTGFSLNLDYKPSQNLVCRLEGRLLSSKNAIFETKSTLTNTNFSIATSIALKFTESLKKE